MPDSAPRGKMLISSSIQNVDCWKADCAVPGAVACSWQYECLGDLATSGPNPSHRAAQENTVDVRKARLAQTIEAEIIPRLMIAHQLDALVPSRGAGETTEKPDVAEFVEFVLTQGAGRVVDHVASLLDHGATVEAVCLDLLAPAARRLGELWNQDLVYFTDVSIGLARLQNVMTRIAAMRSPEALNAAGRRSALLVSMQGEMHNFGLFMVTNFFRRAKWDVRGWPLIAEVELLTAIREDPVDLIGFSVSCPEQLDRTAAAIALIRKACRRRGPKIMVGGSYFNDHPQAAEDIRADATSPDGSSAVKIANGLIRSAESSGWRKSA